MTTTERDSMDAAVSDLDGKDEQAMATMVKPETSEE